jgi:TPR repeat protein
LSRVICTTMGECLSAGFRAALAACLMAAVLMGTAVAGPLENAAAALHRGDYATVGRIIQSLADQGDAAAQWRLGRMYYYGLGVPLEWAEALRWYRKAAEQGHAAARYDLGNMYYHACTELDSKENGRTLDVVRLHDGGSIGRRSGREW